MSITIYHNPRCSKSLQTLRLLEQHGLTPTIVEYLTDVPSAADIERLVDLLGVDVRDVICTGESSYTGLQLHDPNLGRAEVGRPPDNVLSILK